MTPETQVKSGRTRREGIKWALRWLEDYHTLLDEGSRPFYRAAVLSCTQFTDREGFIEGATMVAKMHGIPEPCAGARATIKNVTGV